VLSVCDLEELVEPADPVPAG